MTDVEAMLNNPITARGYINQVASSGVDLRIMLPSSTGPDGSIVKPKELSDQEAMRIAKGLYILVNFSVIGVEPC